MLKLERKTGWNFHFSPYERGEDGDCRLPEQCQQWSVPASLGLGPSSQPTPGNNLFLKDFDMDEKK